MASTPPVTLEDVNEKAIEILTRLDARDAQSDQFLDGDPDGGFTRTGSATGAPRGYYPITRADGAIRYIPSLSRLERNAGYVEDSILNFYTTPTTTDAQAFAAAVALNLIRPVHLYFPAGKGKGYQGSYELPAGVIIDSNYPFSMRGDSDRSSNIRFTGTAGIKFVPRARSDIILGSGVMVQTCFNCSDLQFTAAAPNVAYALYLDFQYRESSGSKHGYIRDCDFAVENYLPPSEPTRGDAPGATAASCTWVNGIVIANAWQFVLDCLNFKQEVTYGWNNPAKGNAMVLLLGLCVSIDCYKVGGGAGSFQYGVQYRTIKMPAFKGTWTSGTTWSKLANGRHVGCKVVQPATGATAIVAVVRPEADPYYGFPLVVDKVIGNFNATSSIEIRDELTNELVSTFMPTEIGRIDKPGESFHFWRCEPLVRIGFDIDNSADADGVTYVLAYGLMYSFIGCHTPCNDTHIRLRGVTGVDIVGGEREMATATKAPTFRMIDIDYSTNVHISDQMLAGKALNGVGAYAGIYMDHSYNFTISGNTISGFDKAIRLTASCSGFVVGPNALGGFTADLVEFLGTFDRNTTFIGMNDTSGAALTGFGGASISDIRYYGSFRNVGGPALEAYTQGPNYPGLPTLRVRTGGTRAALNANLAQVFSVQGSDGADNLFNVFGDGTASAARFAATGAGNLLSLVVTASTGQPTASITSTSLPAAFDSSEAQEQLFQINATNAQGQKVSLFYFNMDSSFTCGQIRMNTAVFRMQVATPEGSVAGSAGSIAGSGVAFIGQAWLKRSGTGNTGWVELAQSVKRTTFTANGSFNKAVQSKRVVVRLWGGGGGGGGGGQAAAGTAVSGGAGGGAGAYIERKFDPADLAASVAIVVGSGGAGGAGATAGDGGNGAAGNFSRFGDASYATIAYGGGGGGGGGAARASGSGSSAGFYNAGGSGSGATPGSGTGLGVSAGVAGTGTSSLSETGSAGGGSVAAGTTGSSSGQSAGASGGGGGGGISSANVAANGGTSSQSQGSFTTTAGGTASQGGAGNPGISPTYNKDLPNSGGSGGGAGGTTGGAGGTGGGPSGGGGGGGAGRTAGGRGGDGGVGFVEVIEFF